MTPEELDRKLRRLSDSERRYQAGEQPDEYPYHYDLIDGRRVGFSQMGSRVADYVHERQSRRRESGAIPHEMLPASPFIYVNRHARFRSFPLHRHDFVEMVYMYDGSCVQEVNGEAMRVRKGQVLLLDSDTIHTIRPLGEGDILMNIQFDKRYFDYAFFMRLDLDNIVTSFFSKSAAKGMRHDSYLRFNSENNRRLGLFMVEFLCEWFDPSDHGERVLNDLFSLIATELVSCYGRNTATSEFEFHQSGEIVRILHHIERAYASCTLEDCASSFGMSAGYLSKMLKTQTGSTFTQLVQKQRMSVAKLLLSEGNLPVTEVARSVGYENVSFFYRVFKRSCGVSPGEWREQAHTTRGPDGRPGPFERD